MKILAQKLQYYLKTYVFLNNTLLDSAGIVGMGSVEITSQQVLMFYHLKTRRYVNTVLM